MPWSEWLAGMLYVLLVTFVFRRGEEHGAILMLGVGMYAGILLIVHELRTEVRSLKELMHEKSR
jgi:hypothetical protein